MMNADQIKHRLRATATSLFFAVTVATPVQASVTLADVPLYLTAGVQPNLMFILDDSGSMHWENMPDRHISSGAYYMYGRIDNLYSTGNYTDRAPSFSDGHVYGAFTRSPQFNGVYYNPAVTYTPWPQADDNSLLMPNANPSAALHNPLRPARGSRNLTADNTRNGSWRNCTGITQSAATGLFSFSGCGSFSETQTFWPAVYFLHEGGAFNDWDNYTRVEIRSTTPTYSGHGRENRTDCEDAETATCTYAEEIQNFANWYTYYRSRILAARAGISRAFAQQGSGMRVGYGTINAGWSTVDGVNTDKIVRGVRTFDGAERQAFFDLLYDRDAPAAGTPLRLALRAAGQYFSRADNPGPWGNQPGVNDDTPHLACRQSYSILMTDGFWNGADPGVGNVDGANGPLIEGSGGESYQYTPTDPYQDGRSNTLADVAMRYWHTDLRPFLANEVPTSEQDPAFWQHMVTFGVGLGVTGAIDPAVAWAAVESGTEINWGDPASSDPAKLDDLLHAAINSRGGYFSAADPDSFADQLSATLAAILDRTESSASSVAANSTSLDTGTLIYQARFNSNDWSGQLLAYKVNTDTGELILPPIWDAGQQVPDAAARRIFTLNDVTGNGAPFEWDDLSAAQQAWLNMDALGNVDANGEDRLQWLRGDQSDEEPSGLGFRARPTSVLGDIVNSDPVFVGTQDFGFNALPGVEGSSYTAFRSSAAYTDRFKMLYVGANDGMLHGVLASTIEDEDGNVIQQGGREVLAYVPKAVFPQLRKLTSPEYTHRFFVNGSPRASDAYIDHDGDGSKSWRTVLVGTTGAGARSVFALDVTNPAGFGASNVMWEFTSDDNAELGFTLGDATIARVKAGDKWVALVGNGYNSASHKAQLFILDLETGAPLSVIDTGVGSAAPGEANGLHAPVPVDVDGDRIADFVYAGDLLGNLWKFDLTGNNIADWSLAKPGGVAGPLFTARDDVGKVQPITVRPAVGPNPRGGVMVYFGTGKFFEVGDEIVPADTPIYSFYGIWDKGLAVDRDDLQEQTIDWQGFATFTLPDDSLVTEELRVMSNNTVDYSTQLGWYLDLLNPNLAEGMAEGERVVSRAQERSGRIIFTSMIPADDPCKFGGDGWLIELDSLSGGLIAETVFDLNGDGEFNELDWVEIDDGKGGKIKVPPGAVKSKEGIITAPNIMTDCVGAECKRASGSKGGMELFKESSADPSGRKGWWQLR